MPFVRSLDHQAARIIMYLLYLVFSLLFKELVVVPRNDYLPLERQITEPLVEVKEFLYQNQRLGS